MAADLRIWRQPWDRQPTSRDATPDGAAFCWLPSVGPVDTAASAALGTPTGLTLESSPWGVGFRSDASAERYQFTTHRRLWLQDFTVIWIGVPRGSNALNGTLFASITDATATAAPYVHWVLRRSTANSTIVGLSWNNGSFRTAESASGALVLNTLNGVGMTHKSGRITAWANGRNVIDTGVNVGTISYSGSAPTINLAGAFGNTPDATSLGALVFPWVFSDGQMAKATAEPWSSFKPRRIIVPVAAAGGGGLPTLSNARVTSVTTTTAAPLVDYAY